MESVHFADGFQNQEIRDTGGQLNICCRHNWPAIKVRCDLHVMGFGHGGNLLALQNAACPSQIGLQDGGSPGLQHAGKLKFAAQALPCGNRNAGAGGDLCHFLRHIRWTWLFEPQRIKRGNAFSKSQRTGGGELAMRAKQEIGAVANSSTDFAAKIGTAGQRFLIGHSAIIYGVWPGRIEFHRGEPVGKAGRCHFGAGMRIIVETGRISVFRGIEICIGPQTFIYLAAKQGVHRPFQRLSGNIPAGHFKTADHTLNRRIRPVAESRSVRPVPECLDSVGCVALQIALEHVFGQAADQVRRKAGGVNLAHPGNAAGGGQPYKNEIAATKAGWRCADNKGFE